MIIHVSRFREIVRRFFDVRVNTEAQGKRGGGERKKEKQKGKPTSRSLNG